MLTLLVRRAVRHAGVTTALAVVLLAAGLYSLTQSRLDVFPEFAPPLVVVQTEAPGLSAEQVESLVTQRVETALNGIVGLESLRSQSIQGISAVTATFKDDVDVYRARQLVNEHLGGIAAALPNGVKTPTMTSLSSSTSVVLGLGVTSRSRSALDLGTFVNGTLRPRLLAVPGVSDVSVYGADVRQFQVQVSPQKLILYDLAIADVANVVERATAVRGAGFVETANQRLTLSTLGQSQTVDELAGVVLAHRNGTSVYLRDIGTVKLGREAPFGGATIGLDPGVFVMVNNQYGADITSVTRTIDAVLADMAPAMKKDGFELHRDLFRPAAFVQTSINHLELALAIGTVLVVAVLFAVLANARVTIVSVTAIPLSLLAAVVVLHGFNMSLNTMTLGGLAVALGEVVDDAILDVENIFRRLRENALLSLPLNPLRVVVTASLEVRSAVIYATLVVALVFFPVITLSGVAGRLFAPMGYAYVLATMASLVVALTVTPALSALLLARPGLKPEEPRTYTWLRGQYRRIFVRVERSWRFIIAVVTVSCILTLAMIPFFKTEFLPELREGHYIVHTSTHPGTALSATLALGKQVNTALLRISGVRAVAQQAGRAVGGIDVDGTHYSEFHVDFSPGLNASAQSETYRRMIESLNHFPGMDYSVQTFLTERVQETIAGAPGQFVVSIYGPNLDALDAIAQNVASTLRAVPGATGVTTLAGGTAPSLTIRLRADRLAHWGLTPVDVLSAVQTAYQGTQVAQVYDENQVINVAVMLDDASRSDVASVAALSIRTVDGAMLRLGDLATITQEEGRFSIRHYGGARLQVVSTNVSGVALGDFAPDAREAVTDHVELPAGYYFSFGGEPAAQEQARHDLLVHGAMTFIGIAILLSLALPNPRAITLLLVNIPFSLIGGVLAVAATGSLISLGSLVGFVTLLGITLRNSIMLLFHFERLTVKEGLPWDASTALKGASERLVPIVMTALATGLALLPLAVTSGEPGNEIEGPMAIVILGGLCTSTLLNLVVLPSLALRFVRFDRRSGR